MSPFVVALATDRIIDLPRDVKPHRRTDRKNDFSPCYQFRKIAELQLVDEDIAAAISEVYVFRVLRLPSASAPADVAQTGILVERRKQPQKAEHDTAATLSSVVPLGSVRTAVCSRGRRIEDEL